MHFRDVVTSQGYIVAVAAVGFCVFYECGSVSVRRLACDTLVTFIPFGDFESCFPNRFLNWKQIRIQIKIAEKHLVDFCEYIF